ncbi:MAG: YifB family Mg chelatase-like AAA ATPase [Chitinivibrionales bacterium]|nr:YifB family Mg chelatase-like AAA ATPase [Chitinivibrionales bacterium]
MLAKLRSMAVLGIDAFEIGIEADITDMIPSFTIVGLPDGAVRESRERVMSAIKNCGYEFPARKVTINMAPADVKKEGSAYDLPIAIGLLMADKQVEIKNALDYCIVGELSLDGTVKRIKGMLSMAICARDMGIKGLIVPRECAEEAAVAEGLDIYPVDSLTEALSFLEGFRGNEPYKTDVQALFKKARKYAIDFKDVKGQEHIKRALLVAAGGGHNIMMIGPPGSGKTMLARRLPSVLPDLTLDEALETTKIHSVSGHLDENTPLLATRPFRSPHHTVSDAGLIGGGSYPRPGEVSLSHHGVLFLDELPEFNKNVLENLRQPLEDGKVTISRAAMSLSYPAKFMLAAALNPCPCGYYTEPRHECSCTQPQIQKYMSKISGPLMDRIDIHVEVPALSYEELSRKEPGEDSLSMRTLVEQARKVQRERFKNEKKIFCNAHMESKHIRKYCDLEPDSQNLLKNAIERLGLSARAYDRILKVSRTIADLDGSENVCSSHLAEAIQYRSLDRKLWMGG